MNERQELAARLDAEHRLRVAAGIATRDEDTITARASEVRALLDALSAERAEVEQLRAIKQRAADVRATGARDEVLHLARFILTGETS